MSVTLQRCAACGALAYPRRDVCGACLHDSLVEHDHTGHGTVLSHSTGHISALPAFKEKTPLTIARIRLDDGPVIIAFAPNSVKARHRVCVSDIDGLRAEPLA